MTQHCELLREAAGLDLDLLKEIFDHLRAVLEELKHPDAHRVTERAEQLRLRLVQRNRHDASRRTGWSSCIYAYEELCKCSPRDLSRQRAGQAGRARRPR